MFNNTYIILYW